MSGWKDECSHGRQSHKTPRVQAPITLALSLQTLLSQSFGLSLPMFSSLSFPFHSLPSFPALLPLPATRPLAPWWSLELLQCSAFRPRGWISLSTLLCLCRLGHVTALTNQSRVKVRRVTSTWGREEPACDLQLVTVKV